MAAGTAPAPCVIHKKINLLALQSGPAGILLPPQTKAAPQGRRAQVADWMLEACFPFGPWVTSNLTF